MKKLAFIILLGLISLFSNAQMRPPFPPDRMNSDEVIKMQINDILSHLNLDEETETKFVAEYTAFKKEIGEIAKNARPPKDLKDEDEIEKAIQQNFDVSEQILQIRKKYYLIFKGFMKPSQIQMMYHIENEAGRRMHERRPSEPNDRPMPPRPEGERPEL